MCERKTIDKWQVLSYTSIKWAPGYINSTKRLTDYNHNYLVYYQLVLLIIGLLSLITIFSFISVFFIFDNKTYYFQKRWRWYYKVDWKLENLYSILFSPRFVDLFRKACEICILTLPDDGAMTTFRTVLKYRGPSPHLLCSCYLYQINQVWNGILSLPLSLREHVYHVSFRYVHTFFTIFTACMKRRMNRHPSIHFVSSFW